LTWPFSSRQPTRSPSAIVGKSTSVPNFSASAKTMSKVSREKSAYFAVLQRSSILSNSYSTNF